MNTNVLPQAVFMRTPAVVIYGPCRMQNALFGKLTIFVSTTALIHLTEEQQQVSGFTLILTGGSQSGVAQWCSA